MRAGTATESLAEYRTRARAWLDDHVPPGWQDDLRGATLDEYVEFERWWLGELREGGYLVPHWPAPYGDGASLAEQVVLHEEMTRAWAPDLRCHYVSLHHAAATLIQHGSDDQRRHLDAIVQGELWCQGFSEPNAGSDLAALQTRAVRDGDGYVVNGQKIWSSMAQHADWCLLLARTDPAAPKRDGISFFLLDMRSPGVETRPIRQVTGESEFSEIYLTDVRVPRQCLLGEENRGWRIAKSTLAAERGPGVLSLAEELRQAATWLTDLVQAQGLAGRDDVRQLLGRLHAEAEILRRLCYSQLERLARGTAGAEASIIKLFYSELLQRLTDAGVQLQGLDAHVTRPRRYGRGWNSGDWLLDHLGSWTWTIAGGTNEIQRNILGEVALGLPREPGVA